MHDNKILEKIKPGDKLKFIKITGAQSVTITKCFKPGDILIVISIISTNSYPIYASLERDTSVRTFFKLDEVEINKSLKGIFHEL